MNYWNIFISLAEVEDLKADPKRAALGSVIESSLDKSKGTNCYFKLVQRRNIASLEIQL